MKIEKNAKDLMTPIERKKAIQNGERADRVMAMPFTSEFKCYLSGISVRDFWFDVKKMAQAERIVFNRYGYDRIVIGPNTRGIVEALGGKFIYPENGVPYADAPMISDYKKLDEMEPVEAKRDPRIAVFIEEAKILSKSVVCSSLTKAAIYGHDANWGRILCALGYSGVEFDPEKVDLVFESAAGSIQIIKNGIAVDYSEEEATRILSEPAVTAIANMNQGNAEATAWGCDLTYDYVKINADYRS